MSKMMSELRDELEVPGYVNLIKAVSISDLKKRAHELMDAAEDYGATTPNDMKEVHRKELSEILKKLNIRVEF